MESAPQDGVCVKAEPCEEQCTANEPKFEKVTVKIEPLDDEQVKDEFEYDSVRIKTEPSCSGLSIKEESHVKEEIEIGPVVVERRQTAFSVQVEVKQSVDTPPASPRSSGASVDRARDKGKAKTSKKENTLQKRQTGDNPYKCSQCSYSTKKKINFEVHGTTHTGEKPYSCYKCDQCSYSSAFKYNYVIHVRQHTGEKPFKCDQCTYASANIRALRVHVKKHGNAKPYQCDDCSFSTITKPYLKKHIVRKHSGEKWWFSGTSHFVGKYGKTYGKSGTNKSE